MATAESRKFRKGSPRSSPKASGAELKVSQQHQRLFHYTTMAGLIGILDSDCLWATHFKYLNDKTEFRGASKFIQPSFEAAMHDSLARLKKEDAFYLEITSDTEKKISTECQKLINILHDSTFKAASDPFIFSFCAHGENTTAWRSGLLSQWRAYGRDGGVAIEFDSPELERQMKLDSEAASHSGYTLSSVVYGKNHRDFQFVKSAIQELTPLVDMIVKAMAGVDVWKHETIEEAWMPFVSCTSRLKDPAFSEESEVRLVHLVPGAVHSGRKPGKEIFLRERSGEVVPFVKLLAEDGRLPIKRIIVGPHRNSDERANAIRMRLKSVKRDVEVNVSEIPYLPDT